MLDGNPLEYVTGAGFQYSDFGKWWRDPKKHFKRVHVWLPRLREIATKLHERTLRYFTLCARPMIDVFMLVDDNVLPLNSTTRAIAGVTFCEYDDKSYTEILDLLARPGSGFLGRLQEVALFEDDDYTRGFAALGDIIAERQREGENLSLDQLNRLRLKETSMQFTASFPYDFINLDFCEYYYSDPPEVLVIADTVEKCLSLQHQVSPDADAISISDFILAVTCRYDASLPEQALEFLSDLVAANCTAWTEYEEAIRASRGLTADEWIATHKEDLFFSAWPKHVAKSASKFGWQCEILDYVYYGRPADSREPYTIVCLVVRLRRSSLANDLPVALDALRRDRRVEIPEMTWDSEDGRPLRTHLERVRTLRNKQARFQNREPLPDIDSE